MQILVKREREREREIEENREKGEGGVCLFAKQNKPICNKLLNKIAMQIVAVVVEVKERRKKTK